MKPLDMFKKYEGNPNSEEDHGDLWVAISKCHTRIAVIDERIRVALVFCFLPIAGFIVALQLTLLGLVVGHMVRLA